MHNIEKINNKINMKKIEYYHKNSEVLAYEKVIDSVGDWNEKTYDENGNELTFKDSDGFWSERTYNNKDMELTYKNSDGYWTVKIYDENGNMLIFQDSDNYWYEKTYDENGNMLTFKSSDEHYKIKDREVTKEEFENFQNKPCLGKTVTIDEHVKTINSIELASNLAHNAMLDEMGVSIDEWENDETVVSTTNNANYTEEAQDIFNRWYDYFLNHIDVATI